MLARVLLLILLTSMGCAAENPTFQSMKGTIYADAGQSIVRYTFATKEWDKISYLPNVVWDDINYLNDYELLTSYYIKHRDNIIAVNRHTSSLRTVGKGGHALYFPYQNKLIFYAPVKNEGRMALFIADYTDPAGSAIEIDGAPPASMVTPVKVSEAEFVYTSRRAGHHGIWRYNIRTGQSDQLTSLNNCALWDAFWKKNTQQLLCSEIKDNESPTGRYYLSDLKGKHVEYIKFGTGTFRPVTYIDRYDVVVLQQTTSELFPLHEIYPVWLYDMKTGQKKKIADNKVPMGKGVWYPD